MTAPDPRFPLLRADLHPLFLEPPDPDGRVDLDAVVRDDNEQEEDQ